MWKHAIAGLGALALAVAVTPVGVAQARGETCNWNGNVRPLIAKADRQVRQVDIAAKAEQYYGPGVTVSSYTRMEVDLEAAPGATTRPLDPATLTRNHVTYNLALNTSDGGTTASVQMRYSGLCKVTAVFVPQPWVGSTGTGQPLRVSAKKALRLAQEYRVKNDLPRSEPLVMMNLMQSTTAPPDFGKLRWYVNYQTSTGGLTILAVYMNGKVSQTG